MKYVKILVDSQAALLAVDNTEVTSRTVLQARKKLNELANKVRRVTLVWIPAHKGHQGNERADELAKQGAATNDLDRKLNVKRPQASLKSMIENKIYEQWGEEWRSDTIANHAKGFYSFPDKNKAKYVYKLARLELGRFVRLITGHNNLNYFQNRIGLQHKKYCRWCNSGHETINHFIHECPKFWKISREVLGLEPPTNNQKWSVRALLDFTYVPEINEAFEGDLEGGDDPDPGTTTLDTSSDQNETFTQ